MTEIVYATMPFVGSLSVFLISAFSQHVTFLLRNTASFTECFFTHSSASVSLCQSVVKDTTQQGPLLFHQGHACQRICGDGNNTTRVAYCFCAAVMPVRESVVTDTKTEESGKHTKSHGPFLLKDCLSESAVTDTTQEALPVQPTFYNRLLHATVGIKFPTTRF